MLESTSLNGTKDSDTFVGLKIQELTRVLKDYSPTGRRKHGRPLKRLDM
jgi:hypothetical protein